MKYQFIICSVMQKEAHFCIDRTKNDIDTVLIEQGLHDEPDKLQTEVQKALENTLDADNKSYDASLLGYGLCSNGIVGLSCSIPLVVPRGHDCITLLLGSKERYKEYFESHRGIYWYSPGWIKESDPPSKQRYKRLFAEYKQKYGEDNAKYLLETEQSWMKEYSWAAYVDWQLPNTEHYKQFTKDCAEFLGWKYDELKADPSLMQRLVDGDWADEDFLVLNPGQQITENLTCDKIIKAQ